MTAFPNPPAGELLVCYGGGVNSVAALVRLAHLGLVPRAIVMADPGHERRETLRFRDEILPDWLSAHGFPPVTVVSRESEGRLRPLVTHHETLGEECARIASLPSVAYGWKKCSPKFKAEPQGWWIARQAWAQEAWARGERIVKTIGYDFDEERRVVRGFENATENATENARYVPWYPLFEAKLDRDACIALIAGEGLPIPPKSACTFCPNNTLAEWEAIRDTDPEAFAYALAMSERAYPTLEAPDTTGLMRCGRKGQRQLHLWHAGTYETGFRDVPRPDIRAARLAAPPDEAFAPSPFDEDTWQDMVQNAEVSPLGRDDEDARAAMPCLCAL